jgi:hypothetical protein
MTALTYVARLRRNRLGGSARPAAGEGNFRLCGLSIACMCVDDLLVVYKADQGVHCCWRAAHNCAYMSGTLVAEQQASRQRTAGSRWEATFDTVGCL